MEKLLEDKETEFLLFTQDKKLQSYYLLGINRCPVCVPSGSWWSHYC
jgi:hypothetical protein